MKSVGIAELFSNKVLAELLTLFMLHPAESFHQRQIASLLQRSRSPIQSNLKRLEDLKIITSAADGNRVRYQCNRSSPIFNELRRIVLKTFGFADVLKEGLADLRGEIETAFIFGSVAKGADDSQSDLDLLVIGTVTTKEVVLALKKLSRFLQREINSSVYSKEEFREKYLKGNHFVRSVVKSEKIYLTGSDETLKAIVG
jgi:predicted nucleotidyltransferase